MNYSNETNTQKRELKVLYRHFPEVKKLLISLGCDKTTAEDLFQEALIIYLNKKKDSAFQLTVEPIHFVKQTAKLLWFNEARKQQKINSQRIDLNELEENDWLQKEIRLQQLEKALEKIGEQCKELLQLFYGFGASMNSIAEKMGMRNEKVAKAQKYRCIQKAKELVAHVQTHVSLQTV